MYALQGAFSARVDVGTTRKKTWKDNLESAGLHQRLRYLRLEYSMLKRLWPDFTLHLASPHACKQRGHGKAASFSHARTKPIQKPSIWIRKSGVSKDLRPFLKPVYNIHNVLLRLAGLNGLNGSANRVQFRTRSDGLQALMAHDFVV